MKTDLESLQVVLVGLLEHIAFSDTPGECECARVLSGSQYDRVSERVYVRITGEGARCALCFAFLAATGEELRDRKALRRTLKELAQRSDDSHPPDQRRRSPARSEGDLDGLFSALEIGGRIVDELKRRGR